MFNAAHPVVIFLPMMVVIAGTFVAFINMGFKRAAAAKAGMNADFYRSYLGGHEPEETHVAVRHYANYFEMPVVFYAGCLTTFAIDAVSGATLAFAWVYAIGRTLQSAVHMTYNHPMHRAAPFVIGVLGLIALWTTLAIEVISRV